MNEIWKVCRMADDGTFWSAVGSPASHGLDLEYQLHKETKAPEGTLGCICYAEQERAEKWAGAGPAGFVVLRCTTNYKPKPIVVLFRLDCVHMWRNAERGINAEHRMFAPWFSVAVPSLTPIECVWERGNE